MFDENYNKLVTAKSHKPFIDYSNLQRSLNLKKESLNKAFFLAGGAGFIGSHFTDFLLASPEVQRLTIFDNFSSGRRWHFDHHQDDPRLNVIEGDVKDLNSLTNAMQKHDIVIHFASNPDIAKAAIEPDIDFREGTLLTNNIVEAVRLSSVKKILYTSGSGVYGDLNLTEAHEDYGPLVPVSTYGASKLAGEALISSYCYMFDRKACVFRFGNVVGPRQTHGVGFDFVKRLIQDPQSLRILGDGSQSKSYVYVEDIIAAVMIAHDKAENVFNCFNVATGDYITVTEIARIAAECLELEPEKIKFDYSGGDRGWKGDVPIVRLNTDRIRSLGWTNKRNAKEAIRDSILSMIKDVKTGKI